MDPFLLALSQGDSKNSATPYPASGVRRKLLLVYYNIHKIDVNILRYPHDILSKRYFFYWNAYTLVAMETMGVKRKNPWRLICWLLVLGSVVMIFSFSSQDGTASEGVSLRVTRALITAFNGAPIDEQTPVFDRLHYLIRKLAHGTVYCTLALSLIALAHTYPLPPRRRYLLAAGVCLACACADELQQTFRSGRYGAVTDVLIDMGGAALGLLLFALAWALFHRRQITPKS